ncbi:cell division protein ZapA [Variovorax sp. Root411]|uniref:cell division protein ZapA n=1 Tax=Variovorax sp. Root411 TaxID=1736530 RepID=UPI0007001139|nr:cell division protein ZapA [Variovorax sp. Root411]KQW57531.1 cell division protein ZapA [Variovorax sp. Root411]
MKQIEVQIMGQSYLLGCPDGGEAQLREAVERVDAAMCKIRDAGKVKARDRIAVLASLNLAFDLAAQQAAAAAAPVAAPATAAATDSSDADPKAAQLIQRLDQALAGDGHLL